MKEEKWHTVIPVPSDRLNSDNRRAFASILGLTLNKCVETANLNNLKIQLFNVWADGSDFHIQAIAEKQ